MIPAGEVHVWQRALGAPPRPEDAALLSAEEQARAARFRAEGDRGRYIEAHAFVRRVLSSYLGVPPRALPLYGPLGEKPVLIGAPLHFSLAHCRTRALLALDGAAAIGVDIEENASAPIDEGLARLTLTGGELTRWLALPTEARPAAFYRAWTRKEALLKARGDGLRTPPDQVDVSAAMVHGWTLVDLPLAPPWVGALAVSRPVTLHFRGDDPISPAG